MCTVGWLSYSKNILKCNHFLYMIVHLHVWNSIVAVNSPEVPSEVHLELLSRG